MDKDINIEEVKSNEETDKIMNDIAEETIEGATDKVKEISKKHNEETDKMINEAKEDIHNMCNPEDKQEKIKQEIIYGKIVLSDATLFVDSVTVPNVRHEKEYNGDICIVTLYDISEKDLKKFKNDITAEKTKYHSKRVAKNTGTAIAGVTKGLFGGIKGFGKGVANSFKEEMKKMY